MTRFGKGSKRESHDEPKQGSLLPDAFWCAECEKSGFLPITYVTKSGRITRASCLCHCAAGDRMNDGRRMKYEYARRVGLLCSGKTKHDHWIHHMLRWFELTENDRGMDLIRRVEAADDKAIEVNKWLHEGGFPPLSGPVKDVIERASRAAKE